MENLETTKTIVEVVKMCGDALIALGVATGVGASGYYFWNQGKRIQAMQTAWQKTADLLTDLQRPGTPLSDYFPQYAKDCQKQLNNIISEADALQEEWEGDKRWIRKYIFSQRNYVQRAKDKLESLNELQRNIQSSSSEAYVLRARGHPEPREGEILRPSAAPWPIVNNTGAQTMIPSEHLVYRQTQQGFAMPSPTTHIGAHASASQSSVNVQSPASSTTSLLHGFGPTLPGISPAGQNFPYLAPQGRIPGSRSNTMPVPVEYAHFNQLASTAYGHTAPTPSVPYSPYGQAAYPPSVPYNPNGSGYPPSGSRPQ